ncbi:MAG TPA: putative toxin-antitoxin system toxin component, PIN family [Terracidiphilus sp.]|jgi:putative PIN family toxin of toxin-antitoxin system|nr:putative toxin-antitoxin system toxin component, PIN family [Terracidiphilus sp.]
MRLVLDTDVVVAAMRSPRGGSAELLKRIRKGRASMLLSVALALEYESQCLLAEHRLASGLSEAEVNLFVDRLISLAEPVQSFFRWRPQLRDPVDELVLEAAINGKTAAIVTFNERDLRDARNAFGIEVLRPGEVLRRLEP